MSLAANGQYVSIVKIVESMMRSASWHYMTIVKQRWLLSGMSRFSYLRDEEKYAA